MQAVGGRERKLLSTAIGKLDFKLSKSPSISI